MKGLRVVTVDDEPLALERLNDLLASVDGIETTLALGSGEEAIEAIQQQQPDIVFLDIEMPKIDGFDVVEAISRTELAATPLVVFVTAYPQFAIQAFETGALDFLSKPVRRSRLDVTLERARRAIAHREAATRLAELRTHLGQLRESTTVVEERAVWMKQRGEILSVAVSDIDWIQAEGQYVRLHQGDKSYLMRASVSSILEQLPEDQFMQIHRSTIVNSSNVIRVQSNRRGTTLTLRSGQTLSVGRKFKAGVKEFVR